MALHAAINALADELAAVVKVGPPEDELAAVRVCFGGLSALVAAAELGRVLVRCYD